MKNILDSLRGTGINDESLNFLVKGISLSVGLVILGLIVILMTETLRAEDLNPVVLAMLGVLMTATAGLITISHTTAQINGTAAQVAQASAKAGADTALVQKEAIAAVVNAVLAAQAQASYLPIPKPVLETIPTVEKIVVGE